MKLHYFLLNAALEDPLTDCHNVVVVVVIVVVIIVVSSSNNSRSSQCYVPMKKNVIQDVDILHKSI